MAPVIVAKELYKAYPGFPPVLRGVNIEVQPGEMTAIMGPSGCGKSTMLHVLGMLHKPDAGSLDILGQNVLAFNSEQTASFRRGNMGFVMQASNLFDHSTVFENVEFPLIYENVPPQERWERVIRALDLVRLSARVHYRSNRLSGGEQQRVAIARAMVNNPRILLADEPTGALDARTSRVIMENFRKLCHEGGVAMVMVTHDPKMAEYCDSVYTLEDGLLRCQKHEPPRLAATTQTDFLTPPDPIVRGALVAWRFPSRQHRSILQLASRMHEAQLLSRIYAMTRESIFSSDTGYALPLAIRHMGFWQRWFGSWGFAKNIPKDVALAVMGYFARKLSFASACVMDVWGEEDHLEFLYAAQAQRVAAAVMLAGTGLKVPFAFAVQCEEFPGLGKEYEYIANKASFVTCSTQALRNEFLKRFPSVPGEKVLLLPQAPLFAAKEEENDIVSTPAQPGKPIDILCMSGDGLKKILKALTILKKRNHEIRLTILGKKRLRAAIWHYGLRKMVNFAIRDDNLAEDFRLADIFIAVPDKRPGYNLGMPWQVNEAMYFGRPIISLGLTPGMQPLAANVNCLVVEDISQLADGIESLITNKQKADALGLEARKAARALDINSATRTLADRIVMAAAHAEHVREEKNGL